MTPHARSFALRAAAKVALAAAAAGAAGCDRPEPQVTIPAASPEPPGAEPSGTGPSAIHKPARSSPRGCSVKDVAQPSPGELACCTAQVPADAEGGAAYMRYAAAQSRTHDAGAPTTPEAAACCMALLNGADPARGELAVTADAAWNARRWGCCTALLDDPAARRMSAARCTPWGPPVPPPLDWA